MTEIWYIVLIVYLLTVLQPPTLLDSPRGFRLWYSLFCFRVLIYFDFGFVLFLFCFVFLCFGFRVFVSVFRLLSRLN